MRLGLDVPGVGVGMVVLKDNHVLLYRRLKAPEAGYWNIPGGKVDMMERAEQAARRETEEETGLKIGETAFLGVSEFMSEKEGQHWVSLIYKALDFTGEPSVIEPEKHTEFGWFALDSLPAPHSIFLQDVVRWLKTAG